MPVFTIETTYRLPVFSHRTIEADRIEETCRLAVADDDWEQGNEDHESSGATHVTGIWRGRAAAYAGETVPIPDAFSGSARLEADRRAPRPALPRRSRRAQWACRASMFERWLRHALAAMADSMHDGRQFDLYSVG